MYKVSFDSAQPVVFTSVLMSGYAIHINLPISNNEYWQERIVVKSVSIDDVFGEISHELALAISDNEAEEVIELFENKEEAWRKLRKIQIDAWDSSSNVNSFKCYGVDMWLPQEKRSALMLRLNAEEVMGKSSTYLWYDGNGFEFAISDAKFVLYALEAYASACYDVTATNMNAIKELDLGGLKNFDYKSGYPNKINVPLEQ